MTILVTGGAGFLGAWVIRRLLAGGRTVRVFDRHDDRRLLREIVGDGAEAIDIRTGDIAALADVTAASEGCDFIIHLAAILTPACSADPIRGAHVNLIGTLNVFEAAKAVGMRRIAYASSAGIFGPDDGEYPFPVTHYGAYKLACEGVARGYWHDAGLASIGFRPLIVYGPGRDVGQTAGVSIACREAVAGRPYVIGFSGRTDFIFADDVAAAFEAAVTTPFDGAQALTLKGEVADVSDVVAGIRRTVPGADITWDGPPVPIFAELASGPVEDVLGPLPHTGLDNGLERTIEHYRARGGR